MPEKLLLVVGKHEAKWGEIKWFWERFQNAFNFTIRCITFNHLVKKQIEISSWYFQNIGLYIQCNIIIHYRMVENNTTMKKRPNKTMTCWLCETFSPIMTKQKKGLKQKISVSLFCLLDRNKPFLTSEINIFSCIYVFEVK